MHPLCPVLWRRVHRFICPRKWYINWKGDHSRAQFVYHSTLSKSERVSQFCHPSFKCQHRTFYPTLKCVSSTLPSLFSSALRWLCPHPKSPKINWVALKRYDDYNLVLLTGGSVIILEFTDNWFQTACVHPGGSRMRWSWKSSLLRWFILHCWRVLLGYNIQMPSTGSSATS